MRASSGRYIGMSVIFQRPKDVFTGLPQDVGRGRPFALHIGPYGGVHRTSFRAVLRTSSEVNFVELEKIVE